MFEGVATLTIFLSEVLEGDKSLPVSTVRIRDAIKQIRAHPKKLDVSLRWTFGGNVSPHLVERFPVTVDALTARP